MTKSITLAHGHYLGGQPGHDKPINGPIIIDDTGIHQKVFREMFMIPWTDVQAVAIEGPEEAARRVTATRLLAIGVFAFAAKKKSEVAHLTVTTGSGDVFFSVDKTSPHELRGKLAPFTNRLGS